MAVDLLQGTPIALAAIVTANFYYEMGVITTIARGGKVESLTLPIRFTAGLGMGTLSQPQDAVSFSSTAYSHQTLKMEQPR